MFVTIATTTGFNDLLEAEEVEITHGQLLFREWAYARVPLDMRAMQQLGFTHIPPRAYSIPLASVHTLNITEDDQ